MAFWNNPSWGLLWTLAYCGVIRMHNTHQISINTNLLISIMTCFSVDQLFPGKGLCATYHSLNPSSKVSIKLTAVLGLLTVIKNDLDAILRLSKQRPYVKNYKKLQWRKAMTGWGEGLEQGDEQLIKLTPPPSFSSPCFLERYSLPPGKQLLC